MRARDGGTVRKWDTDEGRGNEKGEDRRWGEERIGTVRERDTEEGRGKGKGEDRRWGGRGRWDYNFESFPRKSICVS
jgi:hypothetical protein